ncbi:meiosis regulator and mRNA stability factor 1-like [Sitodiplosis mosellana]|uniref:meiosis regulator and mRNA stability factor 1-like n=1 Tax=Sitodiplosis mosellana TaxID=263140 RepID=UPI002443B68F|nr:meiosis regulator and mRNA stability factor 1-like [Sitodiplosis mosellana]
MKATKYSYNKAQQPFVETMNSQQSRFYKNILIPPTHQQPILRKGNTALTNTDSYHYIRGNTVNAQNNPQFYQNSHKINTGGMAVFNHNTSSRQRFAPYPSHKRSYAHALVQPTNICYYNYQSQMQQQAQSSNHLNIINQSSITTSPTDSIYSSNQGQTLNVAIGLNDSLHDHNPMTGVTLQISNLDTTIEENDLKQYLINRLKPIATVLSIYFESLSVAKIKLPTDHQARQVITYLHRKKIGHKRITVSYTRESSTLDSSTLRCQVAGLLKDIPNYKLSMYKFRELFQSRFKTSISVMDLHEMKDICTIVGNKNEEFITLRPELINSIESSELMECFQHSVPYCTLHFVKIHRGWAEQEIDPLPNVQMTINQVRDVMYALLKNHKNVIPIATIAHCIQADLNISLERNESGVNFEHLISCVQGIQITSNKFSIKVLSLLNGNEMSPKSKESSISDEVLLPNRYSKYGNVSDSFAQISREIIELIKLSPKATLKFSRFIPAYHNHFGKQCRVADYGYTKLIDLFEALSQVVQVMGEGENRQITLTHKVQMQRFKTDLLRILRTQSTKSILLSHIPMIYEQVQGRKFNVTDYGVCDINDILNTLVNTNVVVVNSIPHMKDTMISIPKRKQSTAEMEKTSHFAAEVVELFKHASQYTILFEKFACSYHYHFGYQCRLSDYGFLKLADLMESISGIVEMEFSNEEDRKICLSSKAAQRVFSEQLKFLIESYSGSSDNLTNLHEVLIYHKKHYGYQIVPQSLGFDDMLTCINALPYIEVISSMGLINIKCHHDDQIFRNKCYAAVHLLVEDKRQALPLSDFIQMFAGRYNDIVDEHLIRTMKHAIEIQQMNNFKCVKMTKLMIFLVNLIDFIGERTVKLNDIHHSLKLSIKSCFPFGYPNLNSFIEAFPDVFVMNISKTSATRNEVSVNSQCILYKADYLNDNNNNNVFSNFDSAFPGATSLALQNSVQSQSLSCGMAGSLEANTYPTFDVSAIPPSMNSSFFGTKITFKPNKINESIESIDTSQKSVELSSENMFQEEDEEYDSICCNNTKIGNESCSVFNSSKTKDCERKSYGCPPKPDTPPISPYWNNPIWGGDETSPIKVHIKLPDLKVVKKTQLLNSPAIMERLCISKKKLIILPETN